MKAIIAIVALCIMLTSTAAAAQTYTAEGWTAEEVSGRALSLVHNTGEARLEAWQTRLPDTGLVTFRETFAASLAKQGFGKPSTSEALVRSYPAVQMLFHKTLAGQEYTLRILEVHIRGVLWHFSCHYKESEELSGKDVTERLHEMAAVLLET